MSYSWAGTVFLGEEPHVFSEGNLPGCYQTCCFFHTTLVSCILRQLSNPFQNVLGCCIWRGRWVACGVCVCICVRRPGSSYLFDVYDEAMWFRCPFFRKGCRRHSGCRTSSLVLFFFFLNEKVFKSLVSLYSIFFCGGISERLTVITSEMLGSLCHHVSDGAAQGGRWFQPTPSCCHLNMPSQHWCTVHILCGITVAVGWQALLPAWKVILNFIG